LALWSSSQNRLMSTDACPPREWHSSTSVRACDKCSCVTCTLIVRYLISRTTPVLDGLISVRQVCLFLADKSCGFVSYECQLWCECNARRWEPQGYCEPRKELCSTRLCLGSWCRSYCRILRARDRRLTQLACELCEGRVFWPSASCRMQEGKPGESDHGSHGLNGWEILANEMKRYEYEISSTGRISYNAPSGYHDDCVIALALANHGRWETGNCGRMLPLRNPAIAGKQDGRPAEGRRRGLGLGRKRSRSLAR
jgi:hypothetical protein